LTASVGRTPQDPPSVILFSKMSTPIPTYHAGKSEFFRTCLKTFLIVDCCINAVKKTGYKREEIVGKMGCTDLHKLTKKQALNFWKPLINGASQVVEGEITSFTKRGKERRLRVRSQGNTRRNPEFITCVAEEIEAG
jgi:hypothetical protein